MITEDIIKWIEKKPYWQQLIALKLLNKEDITEEYFEQIFLTFKKENKLNPDILKKEELRFPNSKTASNNLPNIKWKGLSNVCGVNAIQNNSTLTIGDKVTLIYGENGSGKSGYTRLLNNIFISKGDKNILPNLHVNTSGSPYAKIIFENENQNLEEVNYPEYSEHPYNKRIAVFDSHSAIHDLTKESELSFAPVEFKFFDDFIIYLRKIEDKLYEEILSRDIQNDLIKSFDNETKIKLAVSKLSSETDIEQFKAIVKVSKDDIKKNKEDTIRKAELESMNIDKRKEDFQKLISNLENIKNQAAKLNKAFKLKELSKIKSVISKRNNYKNISSKCGLLQFKDDDIYNLGSKEWKEFITAAKGYYETLEPNVDYCIFCKQDISEITLIDKYWKYLKSDAEKELSIQNNEIELIKNIFLELDCNLFIKKSKIDEWLKENKLELYTELIDVEMEYRDLQSKIIKALQSFEWNDNIDSYEFNYSNIDLAIQDINKEIAKLDIESVQKEIKQLQIYENEYTDKLKAEKLLPDIEKFILESKWVESAKKYKFNTKAITSFQNKLFSQYVTTEYVELFNEECKKLKSEFEVEPKQRGSKGSTLHKLTVKGKSPSEILSEGEQRSLALANFLAETHIDKNNSCIIFDDPISSLDYKRREVIAERLIEEADIKQVVIFTHDLTFLLTLQNKCRNRDLDFLSSTVRKIEKTTGIIDDSIPWIGRPVKQRIGNLRDELNRLLKPMHKKTTQFPPVDKSVYEYEDAAKLWCEKLRETWERTIEEILFNGSVERFNPTIETQKLKEAPFTLDLYLEIEKGMYNCSKWIHDRAPGYGEDAPKPDTLEEYLYECDQFIKRNRAK